MLDSPETDTGWQRLAALGLSFGANFTMQPQVALWIAQKLFRG
jgi:hypothetical protein